MMLPQRRNAFKINSMKRGENNNLEEFVGRDAYFPGKGHPIMSTRYTFKIQQEMECLKKIQLRGRTSFLNGL